jgi:hypothetical protein
MGSLEDDGVCFTTAGLDVSVSPVVLDEPLGAHPVSNSASIKIFKVVRILL